MAQPRRTEQVAAIEPTQSALNRETIPIVAGLMLCMFLVALDATIVSTAMPSVVGNLGGFNLYAWVPAVYLLTSAVSTPVFGKLSDLFGRKPILFVGIGLFLLGSATSGAAPSMLALIFFRALQGLGAGAVQPATMTIIGDLFTLEQRARVQGVFGSVWGVSSVAGPLAGGALVDSVGWRWIFYINVPIGLLAMAVIGWKFHEHSNHRRPTLDFPGALYLSFVLSAILLFLIEGGQQWPWISGPSAALIFVAVLGLWLFIRQELHAPEPALPLDLFRSRIIAVSSLAMLCAGAVMVTVSFEVPLYAQGVLGQDAIHAGLALAPMSIGWPLAGAISGRLALMYGYRATALAGMLLTSCGVALLLLLSSSSSWMTAAAFSFFIGAGLGLSSTPLLIAVQSAVTWGRRGVATAANMFVRSFGGVVGLAVMGAIVNHATGSYGSRQVTNRALDVSARRNVSVAQLHQVHQALFTGVHSAFYAALAGSLVGLVVLFWMPGGSARDHEIREETSSRPAQ